MDYQLLQRRHRLADKGVEVWLIRIYDPADPTTTLLSVTNNPGDISYGGVTYTGYNLKWNEDDRGADAGLPACTFTISNVMRSLVNSMQAGDYYRGCECDVVLYNTAEPLVDYSEDIRNFVIINHNMNMQDVTFFLSSPQEIVDLIPTDVYIPYSCRHQFPNWDNDFVGSRCGYAGVAVSAVVLSGASPVQITATDHGLVSGESCFVKDIAGITPALDGPYVATRLDDDNFTLDDTVSSDYSGSYSGGGSCGYNECPRHKSACRIRGKITRFGATPNLRTESLRVGA